MQLFELPNSDFYYGFLPFEGPDGSLFVTLTAAGNYSIYGVPAGGSAAWHYRVASDTPSTRWNYTKISKDGNFIYTAKTDNQQTIIAKINVATGTPELIDLSDLKTPVPGGNYRQNYAHGISPTDDGGLLVTMGFNEPGGSISGEIIAKNDNNAAGIQAACCLEG